MRARARVRVSCQLPPEAGDGVRGQVLARERLAARGDRRHLRRVGVGPSHLVRFGLGLGLSLGFEPGLGLR